MTFDTSWIPVQVRRGIYSVYAVVSLIGIGINAYYTALPYVKTPDWAVGGLAVLGALAGPVGLLAASNTGPVDPPPQVLEWKSLPGAPEYQVRTSVTESLPTDEDDA